MPGDHNRQNAAAALAALELAGVPRPEAEAAIVRFTGVGRRFELVGARGGVTVYDDYGHNPTELEVTLRTARSLTSGRVIAVYQPHVVERTRQLHHELGEALGLADVAIVTDIIGARDAPREGVTRQARRRLAAARCSGRLGAVARRCSLARARLVASGRPRHHVRRGGAVEDCARDRRRAAPVTLRGHAPSGKMSRSRGSRPSGPVGWRRAFAEPRTIVELEHILRAARERGLGVATVGLGSNLLAADGGVDMLVLRLAGDLAEARTEGTVLVAGGGATNAVCLHRARDAGLGGFEFACAIPGTAGGGVWMNAGAYGSDWSAIVKRALVATADGTGWLTPAELGFSYRHSALQHGQVVAAVEYQLDTARGPTRSAPGFAISSNGGKRHSRRRSARSARCSRTRRESSAPER